MAERGRPTHYTQKIADAICEQLADGKTLREVCRGEDMPPESTVRLWAIRNAGANSDGNGGFTAQYTQAREIGYHAMADELLEIADDGTNDWMERNGEDVGWSVNGEHVQRSRLRLDTRKWMLSKALPKIYGDKLLHGSDPENPLPKPTTIELIGKPVPDDNGAD